MWEDTLNGVVPFLVKPVLPDHLLFSVFPADFRETILEFELEGPFRLFRIVTLGE